MGVVRRRTRIQFYFLFAILAVTSAGCALKLIGDPKGRITPVATQTLESPVVPNDPEEPSAVLSAGHAVVSGGEILQAAGVKVFVSLGERNTPFEQTAPGIRHQTGIVSVVQHF